MFDRCLYFNANYLSRVVGKTWIEAFAPLGLSPAHAYLIRLVLKQPGLLQKEIGDLLHLEKSTVTRFIHKMVDEGYLVRKPSVINEMKQQHIYPTSKAKSIGVELESIGDALYTKLQDSIDLERLQAFVNEMRLITSQL